jgi:hypothetical protein
VRAGETGACPPLQDAVGEREWVGSEREGGARQQKERGVEKEGMESAREGRERVSHLGRALAAWRQATQMPPAAHLPDQTTS